jgi:hypothetical protein
MANITVGCKLPNGLVLEHPKNPDKTVILNGVNKAVISGIDYATTEVDEEFWNAWKESNDKFPALVSGAIFAAKGEANVKAVAKELKDEKTNLEPMRQDGKDKRAAGVKTADKE